MSRYQKFNSTLKTIGEKIASAMNIILRPLGRLFDKIIPPYDQRVDLDSKLIGKEYKIDSAIVRHYLEIQILISIIIIPLGLFLVNLTGSGYNYIISILGIYLFFTSYEMEEIIITSYRIIIRRIGLIERILKIPSDEEHALEHVVSISVGRAPINYALFVFSLPGFFVLFNETIADYSRLLVVIASTTLLIFSLRINRRAVSLHLAGGFTVIMGIRKGIPKRIINAIQQSIYETRPILLDTQEEIPQEVLDIVEKTNKGEPSDSKKQPKPADVEPSDEKPVKGDLDLSTKKLLFTGFEAFASWEVNPTAIAAEYLDGLQFHDVTIIGKIVPLRFAEIETVLKSLMEKYSPDALIMSGQAGGGKIRLERIAQNKAESKTPYNCGTVTTGQLLVEEPEEPDGSAAPDVLMSTLPLAQYYARLQAEKIPVRYSDSAGLFGCNQIFYLGQLLYPDIPSGFIHVPLLPEQGGKASMSQDMITFALQLICQETIDLL